MEQKELVSKISSVHESLRRKRRENEGKDWDLVWKEHTENFSCLQEYAQSMYDLATKVWEPRNASFSTSGLGGSESSRAKLKCRLDWVHSKCRAYYRDQLESNSDTKLKLLDVGSCYNPFKKFSDLFDITAIDLCPAPGLEDEIYKCDFLELKVDVYEEIMEGELFNLNPNRETLTSLKQGSFDTVVFSFFLEYLPDKKQRLESCRKAGDLLKPGGLLFILRPDSNSVTPTGNSRLVKALKVGCAFLGLQRVYFEKLEHLWCMGFVKLEKEDARAYLATGKFRKDFEKVKKSFDVREGSFDELFSISQDFKEIIELDAGDVGSEERMEAEPELFDELPDFFGSEDEN